MRHLRCRGAKGCIPGHLGAESGGCGCTGSPGKELHGEALTGKGGREQCLCILLWLSEKASWSVIAPEGFSCGMGGGRSQPAGFGFPLSQSLSHHFPSGPATSTLVMHGWKGNCHLCISLMSSGSANKPVAPWQSGSNREPPLQGGRSFDQGMYLVPCVVGGGRFPVGRFVTQLPPTIHRCQSRIHLRA